MFLSSEYKKSFVMYYILYFGNSEICTIAVPLGEMSSLRLAKMSGAGASALPCQPRQSANADDLSPMIFPNTVQ